MTFTVTIGGATKRFVNNSMEISDVANGRAALRARVYSSDGSYIPASGDEVIVTRDGTRIFGGNIVSPRVVGAGNKPITPIFTTISAISFKALADRILVTETIADGTTLKAFLQTLETNYFGEIGVTLSGSQVTGPSLPKMAFDAVRLTEVFNQLTEVTRSLGTPYIWEIDFSKVASMFAASSGSTPFDITVGDGNMDGDLVVETTREQYANRIYVKAGENKIGQKSDAFTGDGSTDTFALTYPLAGPIPYGAGDGAVGYGYVTVAGTNESLGGLSSPATITWEYDPVAKTITRRSGAPANGASIAISYDVQFPITVISEDATAISNDGLYEAVYAEPDVYDMAQAQAIADAILARSLDDLQTVEYDTRQAGLSPGMLQDITIPQRSVNGTFLILETNTYNDCGPSALRTHVVAIGGTISASRCGARCIWTGAKLAAVRLSRLVQAW